jgi:hypothetical protein
LQLLVQEDYKYIYDDTETQSHQESVEMKLSEFCLKVGCSKPLAMKVLKEGEGRILMNSQWFVTTKGMQLMEKLTPPRNVLIERSNRWLSEDTNVQPAVLNQIAVNLHQIAYNLMCLVSLIESAPDTDFTDLQGVFTDTGNLEISDVILGIDRYLMAKSTND